MPEAAAPVRRSPLHGRHVALGAKLAEFGGWQMPLDYPAGAVKEHDAVRAAVGVFDVSHLGKLEVRGAGARAFVDRCLTNDLARLTPGQAQYTLCCEAPTGGIVDDLIVYLVSDDELLLVPNAANSAAVQALLEQDLPEGIWVTDRHEQAAVLAVQGPAADAVLEAVGLPVGHPYMSFVRARHHDAEVVVARSGYTGERGYELIVPADAAGSLWDALLGAAGDHDGLPCGLASRDLLRLEMGYPLHGQDLTREVTPNQALLGWAVGWDKPAFWGKDALLAEREAGSTVALRGLVAQGRGIPRAEMSVTLARDLPVGYVTSGTYSPSLRKGVALALINRQVAVGAEVLVDVRGRAEVFVVTRPPFVAAHVRDSRPSVEPTDPRHPGGTT